MPQSSFGKAGHTHHQVLIDFKNEGDHGHKDKFNYFLNRTHTREVICPEHKSTQLQFVDSDFTDTKSHGYSWLNKKNKYGRQINVMSWLSLKGEKEWVKSWLRRWYRCVKGAYYEYPVADVSQSDFCLMFCIYLFRLLDLGGSDLIGSTDIIILTPHI